MILESGRCGSLVRRAFPRRHYRAYAVMVP